ncbi:putative mitochondrial protein [Cucumis melo var. makuwa]|uniref:Mitochondrial protein n=1 Tax=Cucumis melo var. makuwa TaxID=1194695 RepID=A0A5A7SQ17_CUCMM|nr:putative mitochondrial protein [Cucumis melo var. makuwa]TYK03409.1 putative mitochondrial protein [Cucumis melo var. makuwa]
MTEDELVSEYNEKVLEIANNSILLGEKVPKSKIVRKVLRSLARKFDMKTECLTYLIRQKKNYYATLSDEDSDNAEVDHGMNAFTACITEINLDDDGECSDNDEDEELTLEKLKMLRKEDSESRAIQKERLQDLMEENERLMGVISSLKVKLKENGSSKYVLGFDASMGSAKFTSEVRSIRGTHMVWRVKTSEKYKIAFTTVQTTNDAWYFDSGCSRHMTSNESFFTELEECASGLLLDLVRQSHYMNYGREGSQMDDETSIIPDVTSTLLMEIPKGHSQLDGRNINSVKIIDKVMDYETVLVPFANVKKNHPPSSIIGDSSAGITTRKKEKVDYSKMIADLCYVSAIESTFVEITLKDEYWINAMQEELLQFKRYVTKNKAHLVAQGYAQVEGVDFDEIFALVARLEAIRLLLGISYHKLYRSMIGSLLYLTASRPDIAYAFGICALFQLDPRTSHLIVVKRILKYVHRTSDFGILYSFDTTSTLVGYCDADWAGSSNDRKSTYGGCFFVGNNLISRFSKKQNCVISLSTAEAEYISAGSACTQMVRVRGRKFKSTPSRRPYRLPSEKSQEEASSRLHESVLPEFVPVVGESSVPASSIARAPRVPTTTMSDMDLDDRDDVPLARLLERTLIPDVSYKLLVDPSSSIHSQETRSSPSSSLPFASIGAHESVLDDVPSDISTAPVGQPNDRRDEDEVDPQHPVSILKKFLPMMMTNLLFHLLLLISPLHLSRQRGNLNKRDSLSASNMPFCIRLTLLIGSPPLMPPVYLLPYEHFCIKSVMIIRWIPMRSFTISCYDMLAPDTPGPDPKTLALSYRLFQGSHVPDIDHDLPALALTAESRALTNSINLLSERRLEIDAFIRHLKTFAPSTSRKESTAD